MAPSANLHHFAIDARAALFTAQACASGITSVVAHSPKFAIRDIVGDAHFLPDSMHIALGND